LDLPTAALTGLVFTVSEGDTGTSPAADHACSVTAFTLAGIAAATGVAAALRANGTLSSAKLASVE